jgi:hypothetical protein
MPVAITLGAVALVPLIGVSRVYDFGRMKMK